MDTRVHLQSALPDWRERRTLWSKLLSRRCWLPQRPSDQLNGQCTAMPVCVALYLTPTAYHRIIGVTSDTVAIRKELARLHWYTEANGIDTMGLTVVERAHVQTLVGWVRTAGTPLPTPVAGPF